MTHAFSKYGILSAVMAVGVSGTVAAEDKPTAVREIRRVQRTVTIQVPDGGTVITGQTPGEVNEDVVVVQSAGEFWVGLHCEPVGDALRSHLTLAKGVGLLVGEVVADSPAAKAGLKTHDVLVRFGKSELRSIGDLSKVVEATKSAAVDVRIIRRGKAQTVKITPAKRPKQPGGARQLRHLTIKGGGGSPNVIAFLKKANASNDGVFELRVVGPGIAVAPHAKFQAKQSGSKNVTIRIEKSGGGKAVIVVTKDGKTWKTTEDKLDKLPKEIRVRIEKTLKRGTAPSGKYEFDFTIEGRKIGPKNHAVWVQSFPGGGHGFWGPAWGPRPPFPPGPHANVHGVRVVRGGSAPIEKKLDEINKKLDALQRAIESLKKK